MKKYYSLLGLMLVLLMAGCSKEGADEPTPSQPEDAITLTGSCSSGNLTFDSSGGSAKLTFKSSGAWAVTVPEVASSWCVVEPLTGTASEVSPSITVRANDTYDERNATLTIASGSASAKLVVTQKQKDALMVSSSKVEVAAGGETFSLKVKANVGVNYEIPAQYTWLHAGGSRALNESEFTFTADGNDNDEESRSGQILFRGGGMEEIVNVYQAAYNGIILSEKTAHVSAEGGRFAVELKSNVDFTYQIAEGCTWLHEDKSRAFSSHTIYFEADPYDNSNEDRSTTVTFTPPSGLSAEGQVLSVVQYSLGTLVVGTHTINTSCAGGTYTIDFSTNKEMEVKVPSWCSVEESRAVESHSVKIKVEENIYENPRSGEVIISGVEDKTLSETVTINQEGFTYTVDTDLNDGDFSDARSHTFRFSVSSPLNLELEAQEPVEEVGNGMFSIPANYTKGTLGSGSILLRYKDRLIESFPVHYSVPVTPEIRIKEIVTQADAAQASVSIVTNTDIDYRIQSGSDWCSIDSIETHTGSATDIWTFALAENTSPSKRTASIRFSAGGFWNGTVTITQEGKVAEKGSSASVEIPAGGSLEEELGGNVLNIGNLTLSGEVNGPDIVTLRRMVSEGCLTRLDMSNVEIKKDLNTSYNVEGANYYRPTKTTEDNMIGHWLFFKSQLRDIKLPNSLQHIGYKSFAESKVESITLPEGVQTMEESAFYRCLSLRTVTLPSTLKEIPKYAFEICQQLEEVNLAEGIESIGASAFAPYGAYYADSRLRKINIPSTVEYLGARCLMTTQITEATVPASVKYMGDGIFQECRSLISVRFLCEADTLPTNILQNVRNLQSIEFPKGLKVIGRNALDHAGLPNLVIPEGVTTLMDCALNGSGYLSLVLPESLEEIGPFALGYQSRVSTFTIPRNVKKIGNRAFDGSCYFKELHMKCPVPPEHEGDIFFRTFNYADCTLYVPAGSKAAYESDDYWLKFKAIVEE